MPTRIIKPHRLRYVGHFNTSFENLVWDGVPRRKNGSLAAEEVALPDGDGICFDVMETDTSYLIVRIDKLRLRAPVLFVSRRHGPVAPGPKAAHLDAAAAVNILIDAVLAVPEHRDHFASEILRVGGCGGRI